MIERSNNKGKFVIGCCQKKGGSFFPFNKCLKGSTKFLNWSKRFHLQSLVDPDECTGYVHFATGRRRHVRALESRLRWL